MTKRLLAALVCAIMVMALLPAKARAADFNSGGLSFEILTEPDGSTRGTVAVKAVNPDGLTGVIYAAGIFYEDKAYNITEVAAGGFENCTSITGIVLPYCVKVNADAFKNCTALSIVDLSKVETIGNNAFMGCCNITSLNLPMVKDIGNYAFAVSDAIEDVLAELNLAAAETIGDYAFTCRDALETVILPNVDTIGECAFSVADDANDKLTELSLPEASAIDDYAFNNRDALETVNLPKVRTVGGYAFYLCDRLETVTMPKVLSIGEYAFCRVVGLETVSLPSVDSIGDYAFYECSSLSSLTMPNVDDIGKHAFDGCTELTNVDLPKVTTVGEYAFFGCEALETVTMLKATAVDSAAFRDCVALTTVTMPELRTVGDFAFSLCTNLPAVNLPKATTIGGNAFNRCSEISSINLPNVTSVGDFAFSVCTGITSISLPECTTAGMGAFSSCGSLTNVMLPKLTDLGENAFAGCESLQNVALLNINSIGESAFSGCNDLSTITIWKNAPTLGFEALAGVPQTFSIYVPYSAAGYSSGEWVRRTIEGLASVSGTVEDESGAPVAGATVCYDICEGTSDENGEYTVYVKSVNEVLISAEKKGVGVGEITVNALELLVQDQIITLVPPQPAVTVSPESVNVSVGEAVTLTATVANIDAPLYQWYRQSGNRITSINGAESDTYAPPTDEVGTASYFCSVSDASVPSISAMSNAVAVTVTEPEEYEVTRGANGKWTRGGTKDLAFTADGNFENFTSVSVDGTALTSDDYTAVSGSTVVTLKAAYLETLTAGQHTLRIVYTDGFAETHFTVNAAVPPTGDSANPALWLAIAIAAFAAGFIMLRRRQTVR